MNVWLVKLEEPVPLDSDYRPYRMGMLESALVARGHSVLRWCSDLNHLTGTARYGFSTSVVYTDHQRYEFISSGVKYKSPISIGRIVDNFLVKLKILRKARTLEAPDLIVCSMPTPALCKLSADLSNHFSVPLVLDCRDYWPEIISHEAKGWKSLAAKALVFKMQRDLRYACKKACSFVGITEFFTDHLVRYSGRAAGRFDAVFPLGFNPAAIAALAHESDDVREYWVTHGVDIAKQKKIFYFAGRLNSTIYNAIQPVVDAAKALELSEPDVLFVVCGSGSHEVAIKEKFSSCSNVILPGEVEAAALKFLRGHSIAALQPVDRRIDYQNSYSNKFFEYLSSGLPVFSWLDGISGQKLVSEQCGFIYNSAEELTAQVLRFCGDENLRLTMSSRARELFDREFDAEIVYSAYAQHLETVHANSKVRESA
ncbi:glycosyltransferase [Pseudomonas sp. GZD-222]|uniref:glycosyltransferase n=1 Tax=Pseudomonas sp. GZD-222 TaxID=3404805 RepID=UPI003BB48FF4